MSGERPKFVADVEPLKTFAVSVDLSLRPGTYVVLVRGCMPSRGSRHCYLSWYGSDDVDMGLVPSKGERPPVSWTSHHARANPTLLPARPEVVASEGVAGCSVAQGHATGPWWCPRPVWQASSVQDGHGVGVQEHKRQA